MFYYIIIGVSMLASMLVGQMLKSKFAKYSKLALRNGMSGKEVAEKMLQDHGIHDVKIISTPGRLTDHYNPMDKTVNLSEAVYNERNAAAAAVAAHECGHAVQHAVGYSMLQMRSKMVPLLSISSQLMPFILMGGIMLMQFSGNRIVLAIGVGMFAITTLFAFITLPVEFDASNRAIEWMQRKNIVTTPELDGAKDSLKWAAMTYVVAALASLAQLLYYVSILLSNRRND